ncbi:MAG: DUF1512 family protein [Candidatus Aenigmarchaeota archaeon]|nr:DUF1512 family protein [Candidatus Aenigmarchaeota archaeon]
MVLLNQTDALGTILWFVVFFIFMFLYPRLMLSQSIYRMEQSAEKLEEMSRRANIIIMRKSKRGSEVKAKIDGFTEFFVIEPSNIDPYGLVRKIDQTIRGMEHRFTEFAEELAPGLSREEKEQLNYGLRAAIGLRQIAKIVRHFVELTKKFKNWQMAMIINMQLPIIEKIAESEYRGTEAFVNGWPIGDSIGPAVAASFMENPKPAGEDIVYDAVDIEGRKCLVLKAHGPEPSLGRVDEAMNSLMKKNRISRVVTIDAAQKLEGEKSGSVAEGVGFAMGGIGQRELIENVLLPKKIPVDSVVVKVGMTEAILPMKKEIYNSLGNAREAVIRNVRRSKKGEKVLVIGVGNSCGVGDSKKSLDETKKAVEELDRKFKEEQQKEKKGWI